MTEEKEAVNDDNLSNARRPLWAGLMSFFVTGLGQVYNGQWKKGIGFMATEFLLGASIMFFWDDFVSFLLCMSILIGFNLFVAGEAFSTALKKREYKLKRCNQWKVYALFMFAGLAVGAGFDMVLSEYYFKTYKAPTGSMLPTLEVGDHFMVGILQDEPLERGNVVIFRHPQDENVDFVKRIVGMPGESVEIREKVVYINGQPLDEPYAQHTKGDMLPMRDNFGPVVIPSERYFVLGDNREASHDSRWLGPIHRDNFIGRVRYIYFPGDMNKRGWSKRLGKRIR